MSWLSFLGGSESSNAVTPVYSLELTETNFIATDVETIFSRILTDVLERTDGIPENKQQLLWDNCLAGESPDGLVTMLAKAMYSKGELFLVYDVSLNLVRQATNDEKELIKKDYKEKAESKAGVYISFKNFKKADMIKLYSGLEYLTIDALDKAQNLSKTIQIKISDLRASNGLGDSTIAKNQAVSMADGLRDGKDLLMDAKDSIMSASPDLTATNAAMEFINKKRAFYLGMPASYNIGEATKAMSDSGQADAKLIERGLKGYFFSIIKPVMKALFTIDVKFKSDDFQQLNSALEALKTFDMTSDEHLSKENKTGVINSLFSLPVGTLGDKPEKIEPVKVPLPPAK